MPEILQFRLRQTPRGERASTSLVYGFDLASHHLPVDVMHLSARIVEADPEAHSVLLSFKENPVSPSLLSSPPFRTFAKTLNQALPTWPHLFCEQDSLQELLFLASMDNMHIVQFAGEGICVATVPASEFDSRMAALAGILSARLPATQSAQCLKALAARLKR